MTLFKVSLGCCVSLAALCIQSSRSFLL